MSECAPRAARCSRAADSMGATARLRDRSATSRQTACPPEGVAPSPRAPDYGATLWLNRESGGDRQMLFPAQGPRGLFAAIGHLGQYVLVSPGQKLTVVRLGKTDQAERAALVAALAEIVALYTNP